jgi:peptidoglycan hydrolase CwlO-like protein
MKNYNKMTVNELENEMHKIDYEVSDLVMRVEDELDCIEKLYQSITRWNNEIEDLKGLRLEIEDIIQNGEYIG